MRINLYFHRSDLFKLLYACVLPFFLKRYYLSKNVAFLLGSHLLTSEENVIHWGLLFAPVWFFAFSDYSRELDIKNEVAYRFRSLSKWWKYINFKVAFKLAFTYVVFFALEFILLRDKMVWYALGFVLLHALFLYFLGTLIERLIGNLFIVTFLIIVLEITAKRVVAEFLLKPMYYPFSWGMYDYGNSRYIYGGFFTVEVILIQTVFLIGCFLYGEKVKKRSRD